MTFNLKSVSMYANIMHSYTSSLFGIINKATRILSAYAGDTKNFGILSYHKSNTACKILFNFHPNVSLFEETTLTNAVICVNISSPIVN